MIELINNKPKIYRISIPLPENPLKTLNSYLIKTKKRNLLIDTGFNREECWEALRIGLEELKIIIEDTDIFFTHLHSDHCGLVNKLDIKENQIYMGTIDYNYLVDNLEGKNWEKMEKKFEEEGFPSEIAAELRKSNQARAFSPTKIFTANLLNDRDILKIGDIELKCIETPGHTPGHMCLYLEKEKILFSGDHILFDITPNITSWIGVKDSLSNYLKSLEKIKKLKVEKTLSGHRKNKKNLNDRINEILEHHKIRLKETLEIVKSNQGCSAYEVATKMRWNMRGKAWKDFPNNQKWFAVGETMSHLDFLINSGRLIKRKHKEMENYKYFLAK